MKLLRSLCVFAFVMVLALSVVGCGGEPPAGDGADKTSSALYPALGSYDRHLGGYKCANSSLSWSMGTKTTLRLLDPSEGWPPEYTYGISFDLDLDASPALGNISFWSTTIPLKSSNDGGNLHLTNGSSSSIVFTSTPPYTHGYPFPYSEPMEIPQNGITIYDAAPPFHSTVRISLAPHLSPPLDATYGRCNATQNFTTVF